MLLAISPGLVNDRGDAIAINCTAVCLYFNGMFLLG